MCTALSCSTRVPAILFLKRIALQARSYEWQLCAVDQCIDETGMNNTAARPSLQLTLFPVNLFMRVSYQIRVTVGKARPTDAELATIRNRTSIVIGNETVDSRLISPYYPVRFYDLLLSDTGRCAGTGTCYFHASEHLQCS